MKALLALLALPLVACAMGGGDDDDKTPGLAPQGSGKTRTYAATGFSTVALRGGDDVDIRVGPGFSVRADGDTDVLDHLKVSLLGDTLRIGRVRSSGWSWGDKHAKVSITMPALASTAVAGSGDLTVDRVAGARFKATNAGSGHLSIGQLAVDQVEFDLAGSGGVKAAGQVQSLKVSIAGSGDIDAGSLVAARADVSIAGSGGVRAAVRGPAKVSLTGSGDVDLGHDARCQTSKLGSGSVRCGG